MISKKDIVSTIDKADDCFQVCWETLLWFKGGEHSETGVQNFVKFQGILAQTLFNLEKKRREIKHESLSLISRKGKVRPQYYRQRLGILRNYNQGIERTASIGYALGDSFAWYFYKRSRKLLKAHYRQQPSKIQTSLGGIGEIQFIKNVKMLKGYYVLYHGITTFLSLGDFSLVDLKQKKVITTGEIKTLGQSGDMMNLSILIHHAQNIWPKLESKIEFTKPLGLFSNLPDEFRQRNVRQLSRTMSVIQEELNVEKDDRIDIYSDTYQNSADRLFKEARCFHVNYVKAGNGLVLIGHKVRKSKLSTVTLTSGHNTFGKDFGRNKQELTKTVTQSTLKNYLVISWLFYSPVKDVLKQKLPYGIRPIFWWNISTSAAEAIIFQRFVVLTVYNRGYFADMLAASGFEVEYDDELGDFILTVLIDNIRVRINTFSRLCDTIQQHLMTEDAIINLLQKSVSRIRKLDKPSNWNVDVELFME